jgi:hypothetical protein
MDTKMLRMDDLGRPPQQRLFVVPTPMVDPHVSHSMQVPFRTSAKE